MRSTYSIALPSPFLHGPLSHLGPVFGLDQGRCKKVPVELEFEEVLLGGTFRKPASPTKRGAFQGGLMEQRERERHTWSLLR